MLCALAPWSVHASAATQFIDKTTVSVPRQAGRFTLASGSVKDKSPLAGVTITYSAPDLPSEIKIVLEVVPAGARKDDSETLKSLADEVDAQARDVGLRSISARASRWVNVPESFLVKPTAAGPGMGPVDEGIRENFGAETSSTVVGSAIYIRGLNAIRLSVFMPIGSLPNADFNPLVKEIEEALVPAIDIRNFGTCGKLDGASAWAMQEDINRVRKDHCAVSEADARRPVAENSETYTIVFPAGFWSAPASTEPVKKD